MEWILCDVIYVTDMLEIGLFYERGQIWTIVLNAHNLCKKNAGRLELQCRNIAENYTGSVFGVGPLEK